MPFSSRLLCRLSIVFPAGQRIKKTRALSHHTPATVPDAPQEVESTTYVEIRAKDGRALLVAEPAHRVKVENQGIVYLSSSTLPRELSASNCRIQEASPRPTVATSPATSRTIAPITTGPISSIS
jgi:hypothetical protein